MISLASNLLPLLCLTASAAALPHIDSRATSTLLPPSKDPWYAAPDGFENAAPGAILRSRPVPGNLTTLFNASSAAYNFLFRTTDSHYQPSWAVTTLFIPKHQNASSLLSYQIPYNSPDLDASPSYALHNSSQLGSGLVLSDIQAALTRGWLVNVPDFEGHLASFGLGVTEGHATIDSVRASLRSGHATNSSKYALWGYSGGSIASEWAAELQVQYAPEMNFAGAALGGLVSNLTSIFYTTPKTMFAGLVPTALLGVTSQYPAARNYLVSELKTSGPYNRTGFLAALNMSIIDAFPFYANQDTFEYFVNGQAVLQSPLIQEIMDRDGVMGYHGVPQFPLYIYKAIHDEITPIQDSDETVQRYCGIGANIIFERNTVGGHVAEETNGDAPALEWLTNVLAGNYSHTGCTIRDVTWNVTDSPV